MRRVKIGDHERGLLFREGQFRALLGPGRHWLSEWPRPLRVDVVSVRQTFLAHEQLDVIARSGKLGDEARVLDLKDHERALVSVAGRLTAVLRPGLHVLWTVFHEVQVEPIDARPVRFEHADLALVLGVAGAREALEAVAVEAGQVGLLFVEGRHEATLKPGTHAWWKGLGRARVQVVDLREQAADVAGQEIMTADKVTLRLNALVAFRVADALQAVSQSDDFRQALYREAQLVLRAVVGTRELDVLLADKDGVVRELESLLRARVAPLGVELRAFGIRDVILPGEMKELLNRVTEARKAAEAQLITRREEVAAMRSQANTARILESSPTLMRLRELETLERVAQSGKLSVVVGENGLAGRVVGLL